MQSTQQNFQTRDSSLKFRLILIILLFITISAGWALQSFDGRLMQDTTKKFGFTITSSFGYASGESREIVYPYFTTINPYLSELIWEIGGIYLLGADFSVNYKNLIFLNGGLWSAINQGNGEMNDYDWFYNNITDHTHWSNHEIFLQTSYQYDINVSVNFFHFKDFYFSSLLGFKQHKWYWTDKPNFFIYTSVNPNATYIPGLSPLNDYSGVFAYTQGISYEVLYSIPYLGLGLRWERPGYFLQGLVNYTFLAWAEDKDFHILRNLHFYDSVQLIQTLGVALHSKIFLEKSFFISLTGYLQHTFEAAGTLQILEENSEPVTIENAAGIQYTLFTFMLATGWAF